MLKVYRTLMVGNVHVARTMSLGDAIAAGGYDWVHPEFTAANFPNSHPIEGAISITILFLKNTEGEYTDTFELRRWFEAQGYAVGGPRQLLALGAECPCYPQSEQFVALDEVWLNPEDERCYAPALVGQVKRGVCRREIDLADVGTGWTKDVGFITSAKF